MLSRTKQVGDNLYERVDEVADYDARCDDLGVRVLLLVQVPRATHSEELAIVTGAVQY